MATIPKDIPHIQQPKNTFWCGATCLKMLYEYYEVTHPELEEIWNFVKSISWGTGATNCHTFLMAQHARKIGFNSMVVSCNDPRILIDICQNNGIEMICLCRTTLSTKHGHYIVITGQNYKGIYVNDPLDPAEKGKNRLYKVQELLPLLRPIRQFGNAIAQDMQDSFTFLLIAPPEVPTVMITAICPQGCVVEEHAFPSILTLNPKILCLSHDEWFSSYSQKGN